VKHWWVNQNQTYQQETEGGFLWSPKKKKDGSRNQFYDYMCEVEPGDVIFSFSETLIKAIGIATGTAQTAPKPSEFGVAGDNWSNEGWFVPVEFTELEQVIRPKDNMGVLAPLLPAKYSPLQASGDGLQSVYLTAVPPDLAAALRHLLNGQVEAIAERIAVPTDDLGDLEQDRIEKDQALKPTTKLQLIKSRVGQGLFRSRVEALDRRCRVTGIQEIQHLRASHIKPWAASTDVEKLDGSNGLMLSPHVDHLFDRGFISFANDGSLMLSGALSVDVASAWSITQMKPVQPLNPQQAEYMAYHRANVFKQ